VYHTNQKIECLIFGSDKEKQEWVTKIRKIQETSIYN